MMDRVGVPLRHSADTSLPFPASRLPCARTWPWVVFAINPQTTTRHDRSFLPALTPSPAMAIISLHHLLKKIPIAVSCLALALSVSSTRASAASAVISNDAFFKDTSGNPVYSQGGGVFKFGNTYYWYGVKYNGAVTYFNRPVSKNGDTSFNAITCYSSTDLVNWRFENNVCTSATTGFEGSQWVGRMGVAFNSTTKKYVLITQFSGTRGSGELFATCSTPNGTFVFDHIQSSISNVVNGATGDQTVFIDTNGKAYLICSSSNGRAHLYVCPLRPTDYLNVDPGTEIFHGGGREGNCMFKFNGRYYFCSSDLHGWNASHCYVISSANILGPYSSESIMAGTDADFCHVTQTGFFITVQGSSATTVLFCGDRWSDFAGNGLGYNDWCPLSFSGTTPHFNSVTEYNLDAAAGTWSVAPGNNYILNPSFEADRVSQDALAGWTNWTNLTGIDPNGNVSGGHTGRFSMTQTHTAAYSASMHQVATGLPNGVYTLKTWVKSSGGQTTAQIFAKSFGGSEIDVSIARAIGTWTQITLSNINVTNGQCDVGVFSVANANNWVVADDFSLTKN